MITVLCIAIFIMTGLALIFIEVYKIRKHFELVEFHIDVKKIKQRNKKEK